MRHKDVEYFVDYGRGGDYGERAHLTAAEAAEAVVAQCMAHGEAVLDVVIFSEKGARAYGGDDAVERYREDPEASVFERFEFKCNAVGRVP